MRHCQLGAIRELGITDPAACIRAAPTSPEAYYQEIGRAGRDRISSEAELFFCDIESAVTNRLLDPGLSQQEARQVYQAFTARDPLWWQSTETKVLK